MSRDDRISRIGESLETWKHRKETDRQLAYERKMVKKLLKVIGVSTVQMALDKPENPEEQDWYLTFAWLEYRYPSCPVHLAGFGLLNTSYYEFTHPRVRNNKLWPKWNEIRESIGEDKPLACVFTFPQSTGLGDSVLHNADLPYTGGEQPQELYRAQRVTLTGESISMESFTGFTHRLSLVWGSPQ